MGSIKFPSGLQVSRFCRFALVVALSIGFVMGVPSLIDAVYAKKLFSLS